MHHKKGQKSLSRTLLRANITYEGFERLAHPDLHPRAYSTRPPGLARTRLRVPT